jgi:cysteine desulfurase/selenocysteine lyase
VLGLGAAIGFLKSISTDFWTSHKNALLSYAKERLTTLKDIRVIGESHLKCTPLFAFVMEGVHPHDIGTLLDQKNIAVRAGHHCAEPLMKRFGLTATVRASFSLYNRPSDVDALVDGLEYVREVFRS